MARKPAGASSWPLATHPPPRAPAGAARPQAGLRHPQALSHRCAPPSNSRRAPPPAPRGCWQDPAMPTPPTACRSSSKRLALAARPCHCEAASEIRRVQSLSARFLQLDALPPFSRPPHSSTAARHRPHRAVAGEHRASSATSSPSIPSKQTNGFAAASPCSCARRRRAFQSGLAGEGRWSGGVGTRLRWRRRLRGELRAVRRAKNLSRRL